MPRVDFCTVNHTVMVLAVPFTVVMVDLQSELSIVVAVLSVFCPAVSKRVLAFPCFGLFFPRAFNVRANAPFGEGAFNIGIAGTFVCNKTTWLATIAGSILNVPVPDLGATITWCTTLRPGTPSLGFEDTVYGTWCYIALSSFTKRDADAAVCFLDNQWTGTFALSAPTRLSALGPSTVRSHNAFCRAFPNVAMAYIFGKGTNVTTIGRMTQDFASAGRSTAVTGLAAVAPCRPL